MRSVSRTRLPGISPPTILQKTHGPFMFAVSGKKSAPSKTINGYHKGYESHEGTQASARRSARRLGESVNITPPKTTRAQRHS